MKSSFKFIWILLCLTIVVQVGQTFATVHPDSIPHSKEWKEGHDLAAKAWFPGSFATGFGVGFTMPAAIALGSASEVPHNIRGLAAFSGGVLWLWAGSKIHGLAQIEIPDEPLAGYNEQQKSDFIEGYKETTKSKRTSFYIFGVIPGTICGTITAAFIAVAFSGFAD